MADVRFDLSSHGGYIGSFHQLKQKLGTRTPGSVLELTVDVVGGELTVFMEAHSLYLIGFRGSDGQIFALAEDDKSFLEKLRAKFGEGEVAESGIVSRYTGLTWSLRFRKEDLPLALALNRFTLRSGDKESIKAHIDRLAFAICEAARFIPVRCAVACELCDDYRFKRIIAKLCEWCERFNVGERSVEKSAPDKVLSPADQKLRDRLGEGSMHVIAIRGNMFENLSKVEKWMRILSVWPPEQAAQLSEADWKRVRGLKADTYPEFTLGRFEKLTKNWQKLTAIKDVNFQGLLDELHLRYTANATPQEEALVIAEWH
jgi:hypothetical protein